MSKGVTRKWRPSLGLVLGGTLLVVVTLPLFGLAVMPQLAEVVGATWAIGLILLGVVCVTATLAWLLLRLILRPMADLTARADRIVLGDSAATEPLRHYGTKEVSQLGQAVLGMAEALQGREVTIRSYTDHVTHELRTPLAAMKGSVELLEDTPGLPEDARARIATIREAEGRMEHLLDAAHRIARARVPMPAGETRLSAAIQSPERAYPDLRFHQGSGDPVLPMSADALTLILGHLAQNALDAGASALVLESDDARTLSVKNDGPPIADGNQSRIFDPFFTTRRDGGGTGMGLAIVDAMVGASGGRVMLASPAPEPTFRIEFPKGGQA